MADSTPGHDALAQIDRVLAGRSKKDDHALSQATVNLAKLRDGLTAAWRAHGISPAQRKQLDHVNAVITIVLAIHYPLGGIPWPDLEKARAWLADIVQAGEPVA